jgi:hypothetical protein
MVGVSGFPLFYLEVFPICEGDPNELQCMRNVSLKGIGKCKRLAQSQAMLDSVFLSAADIVLLAANADVGEQCQCQCQ